MMTGNNSGKLRLKLEAVFSYCMAIAGGGATAKALDVVINTSDAFVGGAGIVASLLFGGLTLVLIFLGSFNMAKLIDEDL